MQELWQQHFPKTVLWTDNGWKQWNIQQRKGKSQICQILFFHPSSLHPLYNETRRRMRRSSSSFYNIIAAHCNSRMKSQMLPLMQTENFDQDLKGKHYFDIFDFSDKSCMMLWMLLQPAPNTKFCCCCLQCLHSEVAELCVVWRRGLFLQDSLRKMCPEESKPAW